MKTQQRTTIVPIVPSLTPLSVSLFRSIYLSFIKAQMLSHAKKRQASHGFIVLFNGCRGRIESEHSLELFSSMLSSSVIHLSSDVLNFRCLIACLFRDYAVLRFHRYGDHFPFNVLIRFLSQLLRDFKQPSCSELELQVPGATATTRKYCCDLWNI